MTLDEAIEYHIKVAVQRAIADEEKGNYEKWNETKFMTKKESEQIIADNRQLAEWLKELKQWRRVYGVCPSYEMCIPECKEGYNAQIAEYKRLLKAAVDDMKTLVRCDSVQDCLVCKYQLRDCDGFAFEWKHMEDVNNLINPIE